MHMETVYYAKSKLPNGAQPLAAEHLRAVSKLAADYGKTVGMAEQARVAGLLHDFGKYSDAFQAVLRGLLQNVDHAVCGAALLMLIRAGKLNATERSVLEAVNAHHAGLMDYGLLEPLLRQTIMGVPHLTVNDGKTPALGGKEKYAQAFQRFRDDFPQEQLRIPKWDMPPDSGNLETMLYTRMLYSCLVDADYSVSAGEGDADYFERIKQPPLDAKACLERLYQFRDQIRQKARGDHPVNRIRNQVFEACGEMGTHAPGGLFTLTAPTGTGKTLALLHFALKHALAAGKERIIVVLPFLTLAEQNGAVYEKIMPTVLTDHSQSRMGESLRELSGKWNGPFIITTSVKFFETLFAKEPGDCRKLHSLANSIVIFDEAQSLPPHLTGATLKAVNELCRRYRMTMVFSTATQPSFEAIPGLTWVPREILPEGEGYYRQLRRVSVQWRLDSRTDVEEIGREMCEQSSVCGIFNLRRHARQVYELLRQKDQESAFLISTDLCPAHRLRVVETIRQRLAQGQPCRVAATQCIEAGVDLDFRCLYRALAPLDSVIQAAGRCNRNGAPESGRVVIFEPEDARAYPDKDYQNAAMLVKFLVQNGGVDIHDPGDIRRYYRLLLGEAEDKKELTKAIAERNYEQTDRHYRLIDNGGEKLIVPYGPMGREYAALRQTLLHTGMTPALMRQAAPLTVTVFNTGTLEQFAEPVMLHRRGGGQPVPSGYWLLRAQHRECYSDKSGLKLPEEKDSKNFCFMP